MKILIACSMIAAASTAMAGSLVTATGPLDPAAEFAPKITLTDRAPLQVQVGPTNPAPSVTLPVNYSAYVAFEQTGGHWKVANVIGAVGANVWVQPISAQWSVAQNGWTGGTIDGGAGVGTGFGIYYQTTKGFWSSVKVGLSGGADTISGQKAGFYGGISVIGTIKFGG